MFQNKKNPYFHILSSKESFGEYSLAWGDHCDSTRRTQNILEFILWAGKKDTDIMITAT